MLDPESNYEIFPVRGEFAVFSNKGEGLKTNGLNIYPTPCGIWPNGEKASVSLSEFKELYKQKKVIKTVGVHLTPTFDLEGNISNEVIIGPAQVGNIDREDFRSKYTEKDYLDSVKSFFPNLRLEDIRLHQTGIQAKLKDHSDFVINKGKNYINLIGIDSPGLTSCLAIAKYVKKLL